MGHFIDRRLNPKGKSTVNRERFIQRYKKQLKEAVDRAAAGRKLGDLEGGAEVSVPAGDTSEPTFRHGHGGDRDAVHPGNREFVQGDRLPKPQGGGGGGGNGDGSQGDAQDDDFTFTLSKDEFLRLYFEDMELPNHVPTSVANSVEVKPYTAGYTLDGNPSRLSLPKTFQRAIARRVAQEGALDAEIVALERQPETALRDALLTDLRKRRTELPFLSEHDLRYRAVTQALKPNWRAVMFCLMDVSASMDANRKDLAKRFFVLLHLFLQRKYGDVELVFIRHTDDADEVDEETFFHSPKSGGTKVLSALQLMDRLVRERYSGGGWNVYGAQASDGDAFGSDPAESALFLQQHVLPATRHFAYMELGASGAGTFNLSSLWAAYARLRGQTFAMAQAAQRRDVYPALHHIFKKA
jgi:uncharacterized protein